jgi:hypothetical protein
MHIKTRKKCFNSDDVDAAAKLFPRTPPTLFLIFIFQKQMQKKVAFVDFNLASYYLYLTLCSIQSHFFSQTAIVLTRKLSFKTITHVAASSSLE